jgi:hypothetical protein
VSIEDKLQHLAATVALEGDRQRSAMAAGLQETIRGLRVDGARNRPVVPNQVNHNGSGRLFGWSLRATGSDATVTLHDGRDANADIVATFTVQVAGPGSTVSLPGGGVGITEALFVEVSGGAITGAVWLGP